jgi:hypothetical protein
MNSNFNLIYSARRAILDSLKALYPHIMAIAIHVTDLSALLYSVDSLCRFDNAVPIVLLSLAEFTLRYPCSRLEMCAIEFLNSDTIEENSAMIQLSFCFLWGGGGYKI